MVSGFKERGSKQFDLYRKKFDLVCSSFAGYAAKPKPHIICTPHQLEDDFVQNTFPLSTNVHAW